jgi:hypothetical protein
MPANIGSSSSNAAPNAKPVRHCHQTDLSRRWNISPRTLERWRWQGKGPRYLKVGRRILYRIEDVLAYESGNMREPRDEKEASSSAP